MEIDHRAWIAFGLGVALALVSPPTNADGEPIDSEAAAPVSIHRDQASHLSLLGVDRWQHTGYRGQGIKIAILDTGFRGYRDQLGKMLPARVQTRCCGLSNNPIRPWNCSAMRCGSMD